MTVQQQVAEFHRAFDVAVGVPWSAEPADLRVGLIAEECVEAIGALQAGDLAAIAQELADLVYVAYGAAASLGIDLDVAVAAVHAANMRKLGLDDRPVLRADGKVMKPVGWVPPDVTAALPAPPPT